MLELVPRLKLLRVLQLLVSLLILKVTLAIVAGYRDYFPPNFESDFLLGRQAYFKGGYRAAFYAHIVAGPATLLLGLLLISERMQIRFPKLHQSLGKLQGLLVLLVLAPSGLWMAFHAGTVAAGGFAVLAVATALFVALGWRAAVTKRLDVHRRWMWRCFLLLSSAVVLRLIGGLTSVTGIGGEWSYPAAAWASWLLPLAIYEAGTRWIRCGSLATQAQDRGRICHPCLPSRPLLGECQSTSASTSSLPAMEMSARR